MSRHKAVQAGVEDRGDPGPDQNPVRAKMSPIGIEALKRIIQERAKETEEAARSTITPWDFRIAVDDAAKQLADPAGQASEPTFYDVPNPIVPAPMPEAPRVPRRYRSVFTGRMEEVPDETPPQPPRRAEPVEPIYTRRLSARMRERTASHVRGMERGYFDALQGRRPDMAVLGSEDPWLAQGYRIGYAKFEREGR